MIKIWRCKFIFNPVYERQDGIPLKVYQLENKHFYSPLLAWQMICSVLEDLDEDDCASLANVKVWRER